ncbi:MAG TPA: hypothetical protein VF026_05205 [Ktedonobacteraceae bacterium]
MTSRGGSGDVVGGGCLHRPGVAWGTGRITPEHAPPRPRAVQAPPPLIHHHPRPY